MGSPKAAENEFNAIASGKPVEVKESVKKALIMADSEMAKYKMVYMVDPNHRLLVLRFPNRRPDQPYDELHGTKPLELRIKPKSGLVELDVPILFNLSEQDRHKAFRVQRAMMKSAVILKGGSYGIAGGFGVNEELAPLKKGPSRAKEDEEDPSLEPPDPDFGDWDNARSSDHFFKKITLSGMIQRYDDTKPRLMAGTFREKVLYLSHVDAVVELTVSFQHLDALSDLDRKAARFQRNARDGKEAEGERQVASQQVQAKAVNVAVKSSEPEEGMPEGRSRIKEMLQDMAEEPWQRMKWTDHDAAESYRTFDEHFGLNKESKQLPELVSTVTPQEYLDSISCPRYDHTLNKYRQMTFPARGRLGNRQKVFVDTEGDVYEDINDERDMPSDVDEHNEWRQHDVQRAEDSDDGGEDPGAEFGSAEEKTEEDGYDTDTSWESVSKDP